MHSRQVQIDCKGTEEQNTSVLANFIILHLLLERNSDALSSKQISLFLVLLLRSTRKEEE